MRCSLEDEVLAQRMARAGLYTTSEENQVELLGRLRDAGLLPRKSASSSMGCARRATSRRTFLRQLQTKSGIWFLDGRRPQNHSRPLENWFTPGGLAAMLEQDIDQANAQLAAEPTEYLGLRDYQVAAIRAAEAAIERGDPTCLLAMATGTGKTRTCIGLTYRLLKTRRFRRVLFLVGRSALGEQTANAYKDARLENLQTFTQIFDMKMLGDIKPDPDTKLQIAT